MSWENILKSFEARKEKLVRSWKRWLQDWKYDYERAFPRTEEEETLKEPMSLITQAIKRMEAANNLRDLERWHKVAIVNSRKLHHYMGERGPEGPESFDIDWDTSPSKF